MGLWTMSPDFNADDPARMRPGGLWPKRQVGGPCRAARAHEAIAGRQGASIPDAGHQAIIADLARLHALFGDAAASAPPSLVAAKLAEQQFRTQLRRVCAYLLGR